MFEDIIIDNPEVEKKKGPQRYRICLGCENLIKTNEKCPTCEKSPTQGESRKTTGYGTINFNTGIEFIFSRHRYRCITEMLRR